MSEEEALILEQEGRTALSEMGEFVPDFDDAISQAEIDEPPAHRPAVSIPVDGEWQGFPSAAAAEQAAYADFKAASHRNAQNFHITDDALGVGGAKAKFRANMAAIQLLHICLTLEQMGFEIEASHHEVAEGQHEIDFKYADALTTADNVVTFRLAVKTIAKKYGLHATFIPKPIFGINGSGMHTNMSLFKDGKNAFFDPAGELQLSDKAYSFIAGVLKHVAGITAVTNPLVNSYKRLVPGYEAPCYIAWSASNRTDIIRIPASRGAGTRVELRSPDPSTNPYLCLACCLAAGMDGIKNNLPAPDSVDVNLFKSTQEERDALGVKNLPGSLYEALKTMEEDGLVKEVLGEHAYNAFYTSKMQEWDSFRMFVSQWELDEYMTIY